MRGFQQQYWGCLALSVFTLGQLIYAFWPKAGSIHTKSKKIGFYNICLWSESGQEPACYAMQDLQQEVNIHPYMVMAGLVCAYGTLPLCLFTLLSFVLARHGDDEDLWQFAVWLIAIAVVTLSIGLGTYVVVIWALIPWVELNSTVMWLGGAYVTLLLQGFLAKRYKWEAEEVILKQVQV